jgi:NADP-dependent 3-hydroxy acid dehydrogenase YdfG
MAGGERKTAVITGASRGIGAATARRLASDGFDVVLGARRLEEIEKIAADIGGVALQLDVTDAASVDAFVGELDRVNVLVNNAGLAVGTGQVEEYTEEHYRTMWETNVLGLLLMTRALIPSLEASGDGHIVNVGSTAGRWAYKGGTGYTITKHAVRVITETLRIELVGRPIRVSEVAPGMVETDFSIVRFGGDEAAAAKVYEGMTPLVADDIADAISWVVTRPPHVNVDEIVIKPRDQVAPWLIHRDTD